MDIFQTKRRGKQTRGKLVTAATIDVRVFFFPFLLCEVLEMKKVVFQKWCSRSTPALTPGIAHVAPWPRGRAVGVCPSARPPFHLSFSVSLCVILSEAFSISYLVLRVLVRACRQEELHGGGVTVARGINESRGANLYMRGKRRWRME